MSSLVLPLFWDLAVPDAKARVLAANKLVNTLQEQQDAHEEENWCPDLAYSLRRLYRGLCSSRSGARQGFSLALTEILTALDIVETKTAVNLLEKHVSLPRTASRKETREFYFGRIFAYLAISKAGRISDLSGEKIVSIIKELVRYSAKRPLQELTFYAIGVIIKSLPFSVFYSRVWPYLRDNHFQGSNPSQYTVEEVGLALAVNQCYEINQLNDPDFDGKAKKCENRHIHKLLESKHLPLLVTPLGESTYVSPRVHGVWYQVFDHLLSKDQDSKQKKKNNVPAWANAWQILVDSALFGTNSEHRKYLGFNLFTYLLQKLTSLPTEGSSSEESVAVRNSSLNHLFSQNFTRCFMNQLSSKKSHLHVSAMHVRSKMLQVAKNDTHLALHLVNQLVNKGGYNFDAKTKSRTVATLLSSLTLGNTESDSDGQVFDYVQGMVRLFQEGDHRKAKPQKKRGKKKNQKKQKADENNDEASNLEQIQLLVVSQLFIISQNRHLIHFTQVPENVEESWLLTILKFFLEHGFFESCDTDRPISDNVSGKCRQHFFSLLHNLMSESYRRVHGKQEETDNDEDEKSDEKDEKDNKKQNKSSQLLPVYFFSQKAHEFWTSLESNTSTLLRVELDDNASTIRGSNLVLIDNVIELLESTQSEIVDLAAEKAAKAEKKRKTKKMLARIQEIKNQLDALRNTTKQLESMILLLTHVGFLQLTDSEPTATGLLFELEIIFQKAFTDTDEPEQPKKPPKKSKKTEKKAVRRSSRRRKQQEPESEEEEEEDDDGEDSDLQLPYMTILTDILLTLLCMPSALIREIAKEVFGAFCTTMNEEALMTLVQLVEAKQRVERESEEGDAEDAEQDQEEKKDNKNKRKRRNRKAKKTSLIRTDERAEEEARELANNDDIFDLMDDEKIDAHDDGNDDDNDDDDDDDDDDMGVDDLDAMMNKEGLTENERDAVMQALQNVEAMDNHLAIMIKQRNQRKQAEKETRTQKQHFKMRVLDLIEIYIRKQSSNPLILKLFVPLLNALSQQRSPDKESFMNRVFAMYRKRLCKPKEYPRVQYNDDSDADQEGVPIAEIRSLLESLFVRAKKSPHRDTTAMILSTALYLIRLAAPSYTTVHSHNQNRDDNDTDLKEAEQKEFIDFVADLYDQAAHDYLTKRHSNLNAKFFLDVVNECPTVAMKLAHSLMQLQIDDAIVTQFLVNDGLILLQAIVKSSRFLSDATTKQVNQLSKKLGKMMEKTLQRTVEKVTSQPEEQKQDSGDIDDDCGAGSDGEHDTKANGKKRKRTNQENAKAKKKQKINNKGSPSAAAIRKKQINSVKTSFKLCNAFVSTIKRYVSQNQEDRKQATVAFDRYMPLLLTSQLDSDLEDLPEILQKPLNCLVKNLKANIQHKPDQSRYPEKKQQKNGAESGETSNKQKKRKTTVDNGESSAKKPKKGTNKKKKKKARK